MKLKRIISLSLVVISISLSLVGCSENNNKSNDTQNPVNKAANTEKSDTEYVNMDKEGASYKVSRDEAKNIVNDKFKNIIDSNNLVIGGDFFGLSDGISIENQNYYVFYFEGKDQSAETSKRILVDASTGEIYGNYTSKKSELIAIDDFINDVVKDKSNLN
ncbi:MAG: PepSY domain-containing protein [Clostridia bacterium]